MVSACGAPARHQRGQHADVEGGDLRVQQVREQALPEREPAVER